MLVYIEILVVLNALARALRSLTGRCADSLQSAKAKREPPNGLE